MRTLRVAALLGLAGVALWAQSSRAEDFSGADFSLANPALQTSSPGLCESGAASPTMAFEWMVPMDIPPARPSAKTVAQIESKTPQLKPGLLERLTGGAAKFDYATAEIGFLYGRSTGKFGGESKQTYITGEAGNDKTQIFVGASYEDSSFQLPRRR
ncbi:MAG: hypothetical protein ACR2FX_09040 [Chthoniobacterales bacterium]